MRSGHVHNPETGDPRPPEAPPRPVSPTWTSPDTPRNVGLIRAVQGQASLAGEGSGHFPVPDHAGVTSHAALVTETRPHETAPVPSSWAQPGPRWGMGDGGPPGVITLTAATDPSILRPSTRTHCAPGPGTERRGGITMWPSRDGPSGAAHWPSEVQPVKAIGTGTRPVSEGAKGRVTAAIWGPEPRPTPWAQPCRGPGGASRA